MLEQVSCQELALVSQAIGSSWSLYRSKAWYNVLSPSCLKLRISSSCLAVFYGGQYLWIKAFLRRSQELTVPGGSLSTHRLADPVKVMGKTHSMIASCDTPGMLNKLTILQIEGHGSAAVYIGHKEKYIRDVHYAPCLAHNMLNVGQLMESSYSLKFDDGKCIIKNKATHESENPKRAKDVLELVHSDLCGPLRTDSLAGSRYFFLFTDDYSRMSWVYFLKLKSETFEFFKKFKALAEKQTRKNLKVLRTDHGGEFVSIEFIAYYNEEEVKRELTAPYTPERNRVAERKNRTVVEMGRSMLNSFLAKVVVVAVYLLNISPTKLVWNQLHMKHGEPDNEDENASLMAMFAGEQVSVMESLKYKEWRNVMEDELHAIKRNQTWVYVDLPVDRDSGLSSSNGGLKAAVYRFRISFFLKAIWETNLYQFDFLEAVWSLVFVAVCVGSDTRPPMLDRSDFASWQQRIHLYCQGKDNGGNILKSIDEGPFKMGKFRETLAEGEEGALHLGLKQDRVFANLSPEEKDRFKADIRATNILLQGLPKHIYTLINHYTDAKDIWDNVKMLLEGFTPTDDLIENLTKTVALLAQSYKTHLPQTNNQLRTSSNTRNQATVQNGRVVVQNVQGRQNRGQGNYARGAVTAGNGGVQNRVGNANPGQARQIKCYNCNGIGHIARNCTQPKRPQNSEYFKDKMLLMQAQENGAVLDEEQLLFIAGGQTNTFDDDVDEEPVQDLALNEDNVFQADQCDAFDSDVDEAPTAQTMFMANLSSADPIYDEASPSYDSDILSEVQDHDNYVDSIGEYHDVHEMQNDVQPNYVVDSDAEYTSDSNMIPYEQYVKDNAVPVVQSNVSSVPNDALMMIINDMHEQTAQCVSANEQSKTINASLTSELARYKEQVELYERWARFELSEREQKINEQLRIIITDRNIKEESLKKELHSIKMQLNSTIGHNKSMREEVATLKKDFKQKENKYLEDFLDMKALKENVEDKLFKQDQSLQTVYMLCKPKPYYDEKNKVAIGYKNPLYLAKAMRVQSALYNGHEIVKTHHAPSIVHDSEDTLETAETTRKKMNEKIKDPMCVKKKVKIIPPEYSKENYLATFTPQKQLTPEQIFWSDDILKEKAKALKERANDPKQITVVTVYPPNTPAKLVPRRITPKSLTEGERGFKQTKECYLTEVIPFFKTLKEHFEGIQKALIKEVKEMKEIFEELEAEVDQNVVDGKCDEIERKNLLIANENLIADFLSKEVFYNATNFVLTVSRFSELHAYTVEQARCLELEAELSKLKHKIQKDDHSEMMKCFSNLEIDHLNLQLKYQHLKERLGKNKSRPSQDTPEFDTVFKINKIKASLQGKDNTIMKLKVQISQLKETQKVTVLQEQNKLFRAENATIKQHYKELYDSIKIMRAQTIENTATLLAENENLKAQIVEKMKCVTMDSIKPKVLTLDKVFGKPIPKELITEAIQTLPYYQQYLDMVARKPTAKRDEQKKTASVANKPKSLHLSLQLVDEPDKEPQPAPEPQIEDDECHLKPTSSGRKRESHCNRRTSCTITPRTTSAKEEKHHRPILCDTPSPTNAKIGADMDKTNSEGDTEILNIAKEQGEDVTNKVDLEEKVGPNPGQSHVALVGPNPEPMHDDFIAIVYPNVHESLKHTTEEHVHLENPLSSLGTLSSMKNLEDNFTFGDQFINDKPAKEDPGKTNMETKVESMVTVPIQQVSSSAPPLSTPVINLTSPKPVSSTIYANFEKKNKVQDQTAQALSSRIFTLENHDLYSIIDKCINENVKEAVQDALQAPIHELFRELLELEMKEILLDRMFESGSYRSLLEHTALYEALDASMERENREEFMDVTAKSRKRCHDDQDPHPPPPMGSDQSKKTRHDFDAFDAPSNTSKEKPNSQSEQPTDDIPIPDDMHLSYSEDTDVDHLSKIKTRPDWLKPIPEEETPETPEPDWVIPPNDLPGPENN
ncbi:retrovirus-related pol polyprotein from transposon TNT 1-94 [Tanacetum coccineum]